MFKGKKCLVDSVSRRPLTQKVVAGYRTNLLPLAGCSDSRERDDPPDKLFLRGGWKRRATGGELIRVNCC